MSLPKINQPLFETTIPSTGEKVKFRPFTVKEEKILLIAQESKDIKQVTLAIKQVISNCFESVNVDKLASFDFEYLLINLRSRSVSDVIEIKFKDEDTGEQVEAAIDLEKVQIVRNEKHKNVITLVDDISLVMDYPKFDMLERLAEVDEKNRQSALFDIMMNCISQVVEGEEVYNLKDFNTDEVSNFIDSLSSENVEKIREFFETIPKIRIEAPYKNSKGKEKTFVAEGTETFFI